MSADLTLNHEYLPLSGMKAFCDASTKLLLGESSQAISQNRVRKACHENVVQCKCDNNDITCVAFVCLCVCACVRHVEYRPSLVLAQFALASSFYRDITT